MLRIVLIPSDFVKTLEELSMYLPYVENGNIYFPPAVHARYGHAQNAEVAARKRI